VAVKTTGADLRGLNVKCGAGASRSAITWAAPATNADDHAVINALRQRNKRYGLQTSVRSRGMAKVTIVERL